MQQNFYDVIVVGAGPAGTILSYELARKGVRALLLEKEKLPRYKLCAGGISHKVVNLLNFDFGSVVEQTIYGVKATYRFKNGGIRLYDQPLAYMVMRDKFDYFLAKKAQEAGATILDGQEVGQIQVVSKGVSVQVVGGEVFRAQILAGADGSRSKIAKMMDLMQNSDFAVALQAEIFVSQNELANWDSVVGIDCGKVPGGYGWVFPKQDHLSIGAWGPAHQAKRLKPYYQRFLASLNLMDKAVKPKGCLISSGRQGMPVQKNRILLLGDAAGLLDPLSGEGIYYAIKSAKLAAPIIIRYLERKASDLQGYEKEIDEQLMPDLESARELSMILTAAPRLGFNLVMQNNSVWEAACHLLRGEETYAKIKEVMKGL